MLWFAFACHDFLAGIKNLFGDDRFMLAFIKFSMKKYESMIEVVFEKILIIGNRKLTATMSSEAELAHAFTEG